MVKSVRIPTNLKRFKNFLLKKKKLSKGTTKTVLLCIKNIRKQYGFKELTPKKITLLFKKLRNKKYSPNYIANFRHAIVKLYQYKKLDLEVEPVKKRRDFKPQFFPDFLIKRLYSFPLRKRWKKQDWQWNLVIELMAKTGLTREQIINLKIKDVDFNKSLIFVRYKKNFSVPIPNDMISKLKEWISDKPKRWYLFTGAKGQLRGESVNKVFWKRAKEIGIDEKVSPRILRHTYLRKLVEKRLPLSKLKRLAGDVNLRHLNRYFEMTK